jgi:hypothetical protein
LGKATSKARGDRQKDLLFQASDQIIDMGHPLVRLAALIDWDFWMSASVQCAKQARGSFACRRGLSPARQQEQQRFATPRFPTALDRFRPMRGKLSRRLKLSPLSRVKKKRRSVPSTLFTN